MDQQDNPSSTTVVARAATASWLAVSAVNLAVWLLIAVIGGHVDQPWFLWAFAAGGVVVAVLRFVERAVTRQPLAGRYPRVTRRDAPS